MVTRKPRRDRWMESELQIIRDNYGRERIQAWQHLLPSRTRDAIEFRAIKIGCTSTVTAWGPTYFDVIHDYFSVPTPQNCYWAGFIAADGSIETTYANANLKVSLSTLDKSHLEKLRDVLAPRKKIMDYCYEKQLGRSTSVFNVNSKRIVDDLARHFLIGPRKSLTLEAPTLNDISLKESFMVGYIDGDGTITKKGDMIRVVGTSNFLAWIKTHMDQYYPGRGGRVAGLRYNRRSPKIYDYGFGAGRAIGLLDTIARYNLPILARKWSRLRA